MGFSLFTGPYLLGVRADDHSGWGNFIPTCRSPCSNVTPPQVGVELQLCRRECCHRCEGSDDPLEEAINGVEGMRYMAQPVLIRNQFYHGDVSDGL